MKLQRKSQFLQLLIVAINLQEEVEAKTKEEKKLNYLDQILSKKGLYIMILLMKKLLKFFLIIFLICQLIKIIMILFLKK